MELVQEAFAGVSPKYFCEICGRPLRNPDSVRIGIGPICRGKHHGGTMQRNDNFDLSQWGSRFDYKGYGGCDCHCYLLVRGNVVICTESPDNHGTSITNMAEALATQVCLKWGIRFENLIWYEHYPHAGSYDMPETFDFVTFQIEGDHLAHPAWRHNAKDEAMAAFNEATSQV